MAMKRPASALVMKRPASAPVDPAAPDEKPRPRKALRASPLSATWPCNQILNDRTVTQSLHELASPFQSARDLSRPVTIVSSSTLPIPMLKHVVTTNAVKYTAAFGGHGANIALFGMHKPSHIFVDVPNDFSECIKHGKACSGHMAIGSAELVLLCGGDANIESIVRSLLCTTCAGIRDMYGIAQCPFLSLPMASFNGE